MNGYRKRCLLLQSAGQRFNFGDERARFLAEKFRKAPVCPRFKTLEGIFFLAQKVDNNR
jgi:hypothetical protein